MPGVDCYKGLLGAHRIIIGNTLLEFALRTREIIAVLVLVAVLGTCVYCATGESSPPPAPAASAAATPVDTPASPAPRKAVAIRLEAPPAASSAVYERGRRAAFDEFIRTHPEYNLTASGGLQLPAGGSGELLGIAGGVSPDVYSIYFQSSHTHIEQGFCLPLDEYLSTWEGYDEVPPQLWPVVTGIGPSFDDKDKEPKEHKYGAINDWPTSYLIYRKDLFREAGLDPDRPPRTWDELFDYAQKLTYPDLRIQNPVNPNASLGRWGLYLPFGHYTFINFVWQAGGDFVRQNPDGSWEAVFDGPGGVTALEYFKRMRWTKWQRNGKTYEGVVRTGFGEAQQIRESRLFASGEVAMVIMAIHRLQDVLAQNVVRMEDIGIAPLPAGPTGIRAQMVDGASWMISSRLANDKARRDAAWEYIRFMTSDEAKRIQTKVYVEAGYARFVRNPHWLERYGYKEYFDEVDPQYVKAFDEALVYGRPEPFAPEYAALGNELSTPLTRAVRDITTDPKTALSEKAKYINMHFYKRYPEEEMRYKRRLFGALAAVMGVALIAMLYFTIKAITARIAYSKSGMSAALKASRWKHFSAWMFLFPAVATIFFWSYLPVLRGSVMSFYDWKILGEHKFIGIDNFVEALSQPIFWQSLGRTFQYSVLSLSMGFITPIVLSLFLSEVPKGKILFRVLFYLPALTSGLVIMFLWKDLFFDPSPAGLLNRIIGFFGADPKGWLQDPDPLFRLPFLPSIVPPMAMLCIILPGVWAGAGPGSIIYLAALRTVPEEMYEASEIDGAGPVQKIFRVTLPYLKPLILINFIGAFIGTFHATQNIFVMTMGGPENATHTLSLEIWFNSFLYLKFGYATAMAWIMASMLIGFTLYQLRIFQKVQFTAGGTNTDVK